MIATKYLVTFVKTNGVEYWYKHPFNTILYTNGSLKHFKGNGRLWRITKICTAVVFRAGISEK